MDWGDTGFKVAGLYGSDWDGSSDFSVRLGSYSWRSIDEENDGGFPFYEYYDEVSYKRLSEPAIVFKDSKVHGVAGFLLPIQGPTPSLSLGSSIGSYYVDCWVEPCYSFINTTLNTSSEFRLLSYYAYGNTYSGPDFVGSWDFANSTVSPIPEPSTWMLMILGFGMAGYALRRRKAFERKSACAVPA